MTTAATPSESEITFSEAIAAVREIAVMIWRRKRKLVLPLAITLSIGLIIAFGQQDEYKATTKILPYRNTPNIGNLSSLAGLAGLRLPTGTNDETITADLYPVLARSFDFQVTLAETPLHFATAEQPVSLITYFTKHPTIARSIGRYWSNFRASLAGDRGAAPGTFTSATGVPLRGYTREHMKLVQELDDRLVVTSDKKTTVITIDGLMPSPYASADLVQSASDMLMRHIIDYEARKAGEQLAFVEEQFGQARTRYEQTQQDLARFTDRNRILASPLAQVERDRLQNEFNVSSEVYQQVAAQLQMARLRKNQDTPVFTVIEHVTVPNQRTSPKRVVILAISMVMGITFGFAVILYDRYKPAPA